MNMFTFETKEMFEDTQEVARSREPKKDRQHNGQKTYPTNTGDEHMFPGIINDSCSTSDTRRVTVKRREHHLIWKSWWTQVY